MNMAKQKKYHKRHAFTNEECEVANIGNANTDGKNIMYNADCMFEGFVRESSVGYLRIRHSRIHPVWTTKHATNANLFGFLYQTCR